MVSLIGFSALGQVCTKTSAAALDCLAQALGFGIRSIGSGIANIFSGVFGRNTEEVYEGCEA